MQSVLNEGSFMDMLNNAAKDVKDYTMQARKDNKDTYMRGSVSKYSKKLILSFPTICDNTIPMSSMQLISKAHEKNIVSMFEILFSSMSLSGSNGVDIIEALHKDLGKSSSIDDIIDAIEKAVSESGSPYSKAEIRDILNEMCYDLKYRQKRLPVDSFSEHSLNDYLVRDMYGKTTVLEDTAGINKVEKAEALDESFDEEDLAILGEDYAYDLYKAKANAAREEEDQRYQNSKDASDNGASDDPNKYNAEDNERKRRRENRDQSKHDQDAQKHSAEMALKSLPQVRDVDYKKANEAQPTLMTVVYNDIITNGNKDTIQVVGKKSFVAGIKSRLVGSDAMEIVDRLTSSVKNKATFKDLIRATTGEISLVKDFLFATKKAKVDAVKNTKGGDTAKMWNLLAARSKKNVYTGYGMKSNEAAAISTLVINQETVNYIANTSKINIDNVKVAAGIMADYNLLCLIIADEANEVAKFLYDGNNSFDMVAYSSLARSNNRSNDDVINFLNKVGR